MSGGYTLGALVRLGDLDMDGLCGRALHPLAADAGEQAILVSESSRFLADEDEPELGEIVVYLARIESGPCKGELREIADYEIETPPADACAYWLDRDVILDERPQPCGCCSGCSMGNQALARGASPKGGRS